jgi:hypothetical protein
MTALLIYPLLTAALYYLLARAEISRFLWSRYPPALDRFMACAACTGFWYGLGAALLGRYYNLPFMALPSDGVHTIFIVGLCSTIWTPVVSWLHLVALDRLGAPMYEDPLEAANTDAIETKP